MSKIGKKGVGELILCTIESSLGWVELNEDKEIGQMKSHNGIRKNVIEKGST